MLRLFYWLGERSEILKAIPGGVIPRSSPNFGPCKNIGPARRNIRT